MLFGVPRADAWLLELHEFRWLLHVRADMERAADYRSGIIAQLVANALRPAGVEAATPGTFFPSLAEDEEEQTDEMTPEETKAFLVAMMQRLGGKPVRMEAWC